jgi:uncharacterized membrane protein
VDTSSTTTICFPGIGKARVDLLILLIITIVAFALRLTGVDSQGYWHDELYTLANLTGFDLYLFPGSDLHFTEAVLPAGEHLSRLSEDKFFSNFWRNIIHEGHPPLYLLSAKLWTAFTYFSPHSIRLFSVVSSTLAVPVMYLVGLRLGGRMVALLASLFLATSPFQIYFSTEARSYGLLALFAATSTLSAVLLREKKPPKTIHWIFWIVSATAACLTHYFASIYCFLLLTLYIFPGGALQGPDRVRRLLLASTPFLVFGAWLPVLYLQVNAHGSGHWTHGSLDFLSSIGSAATGLAELLGGQQVNLEKLEFLFLGLFILTSFIAVLTKNSSRTSRTWQCLLLIIPVHILIVYLLDLALNHHTIAVVRYSSCLAIPLTLILSFALRQMKWVGVALAVVFSIYFVHTSLLVITARREPKQMLLEISSYINQNSTPGDLVVVTPSGPTMMGLAMYLRPETNLTAMPAKSLLDFVRRPGRPPGQRIWSVQQRLGIDIESWAEPTTPDAKSVVRFVGVDLAEY